MKNSLFRMLFIALVRRLSPAMLIITLSCIEPFDPPTEENALGALVVEGFMNANDGVATVKLSHTQTISDNEATTPELNASVSIQSPGGVSYSLSEQDSGRYSIKDLTIDKNVLYSLHIKTKSGSEFFSDTIRVRETPPIDSLNFSVSGIGESITILVTTHDPLHKARYYKWDYVETYQYTAAFYSGFHFINGLLKYRKQEELVYGCWRTVPSPTISIGSTAGLAQDFINRQTITYIPRTSLKISVRYSILVKQMAISEAEYHYLGQLRNTTEDLGGLFGTMPTAVTGNMHQAGAPQATVLGYFSGAEVKEKRFFIERLQLPEYFRVRPSNNGCVMERTCESNPSPPAFGDPPSCVPREIVSPKSIVLSAEHDGYPPFFTFTTPACGDCRYQGGVTKKPEFW